MSIDQEILVDGHLKRELIQEFARSPDDFDDDAVEQIWQHLDVCEDCMDAYEAIREGRFEPGEPAPAPPTASIEPDSLDPAELTVSKIEKKEDDGSHLNGLMPVGDDPDRNGENGASESAVEPIEIERPDAAVSGGREDPPAPEDDAHAGADAETDDEGNGGEKPQAIEGLITGTISASDEPVERMEMETLAEAEERTSRARIQASMLKIKPDAGEEAPEKPGEQPEPEPAPKPETAREPEPAPSEPAPPATARRRAPEPAPARPAPKKRPPSPVQLRPRPPKTARQEPLEQFFHRFGGFLKQPRNAVLCGGGLLVVALAVILAVVVFGPSGQEPSPVAGWEPLDIIETRVPLQEVLIRTLRRGRIPAADGMDVTLDFRGIRTLVIAVDLDFIKGQTMPYEALVRNPGGEIVFHEPIPQIYIDDGRFFLRLLPDLFEVGETYTLELRVASADGGSRIIAESLFDVLE